MIRDDGKEILTLSGWLKRLNVEHMYSIHTLRKRRQISGLGMFVPPSMYYLTKDEFEKVLNTPLPLCGRVRERSKIIE